jgi:hypothetical protein
MTEVKPTTVIETHVVTYDSTKTSTVVETKTMDVTKTRTIVKSTETSASKSQYGR